MKKSIVFSSLLAITTGAQAELQTLDNQQLQMVEAQAGAATINWSLSLNQTSPGVFDTATCADLRFCRFAVSSNNRVDASNRKQWIVLKGVQGSIRLRDVELGGTDLIYSDDSNASKIKAALALSFSETKPIEIRSFGFSAMSIETDSDALETATNFIPGYLAMGSGGSGVNAYSSGKYTNATNLFDKNRETGFTGLTMNGNLALQGSLKVFSCSSDMKRC